MFTCDFSQCWLFSFHSSLSLCSVHCSTRPEPLLCGCADGRWPMHIFFSASSLLLPPRFRHILGNFCNFVKNLMNSQQNVVTLIIFPVKMIIIQSTYVMRRSNLVIQRTEVVFTLENRPGQSCLVWWRRPGRARHHFTSLSLFLDPSLLRAPPAVVTDVVWDFFSSAWIGWLHDWKKGDTAGLLCTYVVYFLAFALYVCEQECILCSKQAVKCW